jgi:pimeloyl-ACP methyl ester carboxylesterase
MKHKKPLLQKYIGTFRYGKKEIHFYFWSHTTDKVEAVDTVILLGSGQSGRIAKWVAGNAPVGTAVVEGLPHKKADRSAHDLKAFARQYTNTAFLAALRAFNISTANLVAESQAAPGAIWTALDHFDKIKNVALIAPLGLTAHILGNSPPERLNELKKRAFISATQFAQSPLYDPRNFCLSFLVLHALLFDARWKVSGQKYAVGASHDLREECRKLARRLHERGNGLTLILGKRDKIFPPSEVMSVLQESKITHVNSVILKTSHASLAIRDGRQILDRAIQAVRQDGGKLGSF